MMDQHLMEQIIATLKTGQGIILLHNNADIDAVGSAIALQSAFPNLSIGAFQKISQLSRRFLEHFPEIEIELQPDLDKFQTILILDTSSPSQIGVEIDIDKTVVVLDHHLRSDYWKEALYYCDDTKTSCAEVVLDFLNFTKFKIDSKTAMILLTAILVDTGHFKYAKEETLLAVIELLKLGRFRLTDIYKLLDNTGTFDHSQRIAHLKGAQRLRFRHHHGFIIAVSQLSSYEASMCKYLLLLGADVAFVGAQHEEKFRISGRASGELMDRGFHLGEFLQNIGADIHCEGGGHAGAAGLNGIGDVEMVLNLCLAKFKTVQNLEL